MDDRVYREVIQMEKMPVYMATTKDKYELPLAIADSPWELARLLQVTESAVCKGLKYTERGGKGGRYHKVWIEMTPEEWEEHRNAVWLARARAEGRL